MVRLSFRGNLQRACTLSAAMLSIAMMPESGAHAAHGSEHVPIADLDLATAQDRARLDRRIRAAADRLCMANGGISSLIMRHVVELCVRDTVASAAPTRAKMIEASSSYVGLSQPAAAASPRPGSDTFGASADRSSAMPPPGPSASLRAPSCRTFLAFRGCETLLIWP
ncbi:UrcA family protein [Sphingomonas sp. ASY06-1R]|uniref:UrcA family protein n=1 Tax=Sphingomonas sp. ASY06-1R TaxID=3445771 RepID=UPI003FA22683